MKNLGNTCDWFGLSPTSASGPVTVSRGVRGSDWPSLGHVTSLAKVGVRFASGKADRMVAGHIYTVTTDPKGALFF